jgi:hypothetical protein
MEKKEKNSSASWGQPVNNYLILKNNLSNKRANSHSKMFFWDEIKKKGDNTLRIGFQNIGGFPVDKGKIKEEILRRGITKWDFDIFGCAETNIDWRKVPKESKLYFRTKEWWDSLHLSWSHNVTMKPVSARQFGGAAIFSIGKAAHRVVEKGGGFIRIR